MLTRSILLTLSVKGGRLSSVGADELSPALQRWVALPLRQSPGGTTDFAICSSHFDQHAGDVVVLRSRTHKRVHFGDHAL